MSQSPVTRHNFSPSMTGQALVKQLREGWAPIPTKTLFTMAMGGLRVRMMRSAVTMLSIILAIAFLAYTGLARSLTMNLGAAVKQLEAAAPVDPKTVNHAIKACLAAEPMGRLAFEDLRRLARSLKVDQITQANMALSSVRSEVVAKQEKVDKLAAKLVSHRRHQKLVEQLMALRADSDPSSEAHRTWLARVDELIKRSHDPIAAAEKKKERQTLVDQLIKFRKDAHPSDEAWTKRGELVDKLITHSWDPNVLPEDLHGEQGRLEQELVVVQHRYDRLKARVDLGQWIRSADAKTTDLQATQLLDALRKRQGYLLGAIRSPERFASKARGARPKAQTADLEPQAPLTLGQAEHLLDHLDGVGLGEPVKVLRKAIDDEQDRRQANEITALLRNNGYKLQDVDRGNPLDTWLICMALITCAVGIANAMLMSVTERFREIGTMKCLGAQDSLVVKLFLIESGVLGIVGAILGIVLGFFVAIAAALLLYGGYGFSYFPLGKDAAVVVGLSILGGILLSVVGAVGPARAAAKMRPVDALRVEE